MNTQATKTVQQLEAEARAAAEALAEAKEQERAAARAAEEAKRKAEYEAKQSAETAARAKVAAALVEALQAAGVNSAHLIEPHKSQVSVLPGDAYDGNCSLSIERAYAASSRYSFRSQPVGWKVIVGQYGDRKSYPQKKDGTFSYAKIAEEVASRLSVRKAAAERQRKEANLSNANDAIVATLKEAFKLRDYGSVRLYPSKYQEERVVVKVAIDKPMTLEQATALLEALDTLNLLDKEPSK